MTASFLVIADTHFCAPGTAEDMTWWNRMLKEQSPAIAESLISTARNLDPDFVIHCGDLTDNGTLASFHNAKEIMDCMPCPYYVTLGNHDTFQAGTREAALVQSDWERIPLNNSLLREPNLKNLVLGL